MVSNLLEKPGDILEGSGFLLQHGRLIASVDYHLAIPTQMHFLVNPTGGFGVDYADHVAGFILLSPGDAASIEPAVYTLELADKRKLSVQIERRYKQIKFKGEPRVSFWIKVAPAG